MFQFKSLKSGMQCDIEVAAYRPGKISGLGQTAESMGREDPDMLYKNYRKAIKEQGILMSSGNWLLERNTIMIRGGESAVFDKSCQEMA